MKTSFLKGHLNKYQMRGKQIKKTQLSEVGGFRGS